MKILLCILVGATILAKAQIKPSYEGIKFEQMLSWEQIKTKAKAVNKYIFVDCYATWCGPCKMMDKNVYPHYRVGAAMNDYFISVRLQLDSTANDNEEIRRWYTTAHDMMKKHKISVLPTYLFFDPDGQMVHKASGYLDVKAFVKLSELARDSNKALYYLRYEAYKQGKKEYPTLGDLAIFTRDLIGDTNQSDVMAKDYKENFLDNLDTASLYTKKNIHFICLFPKLISSKDAFFSLCYNDPPRFDSIKGAKGAANLIVDYVIAHEELENNVLHHGYPIDRAPNWDSLQFRIAIKYKLVDSRKLVLSYKIQYYKDLCKDWALWAKYKDEMIKEYPPKAPYGMEVYTEINGHGGAWHAFLHCSDTTVLKKAIEWVDLALRIDTTGEASYLDTKANLLYKLGRKQDALTLQKKALEMVIENGGFKEEIEKSYHKMQQGEPTWPQK